MIDPYRVLGVAMEADDATIRTRYLELTRQFPPEKDPQRFAQIRSAYELVKDTAARARYHLFGPPTGDILEALIAELKCQTARQRWSLDELMTAIAPPES